MEQQELEVSEPGRKLSGLRLELPWPPSVNSYTKYRTQFPSAGALEKAFDDGGMEELLRLMRSKSFVQTYKSTEAKTFMTNVQAVVFRDRAARQWSCPLKMSIWTYPPDRRKRDTSNIFKMLEDALEAAGVFLDDYQITEHHVWRTTGIVKDGMVIVELEPIVVL